MLWCCTAFYTHVPHKCAAKAAEQLPGINFDKTFVRLESHLLHQCRCLAASECWSHVCAGLPISSAEDDRLLDFETYSRTTSASAAQPRLKGESSEEKKQRKGAVKEAKV